MVLKRTAEYMMRNSRVAIPSSLMEMIDTTLWFVDVTKESTTAQATTAVARAIGTLSEEGAFDYNLLEAFQEVFEGWTKEMFDKLTGDGKRILKQFLREGGVFTGRKNGGIATQLEELLTVEDLPEWNMEEFKRMEFDKRSKAFQRQQQMPTDRTSSAPQRGQTLIQTEVKIPLSALDDQNSVRMSMEHGQGRYTSEQPPPQQQQPIETIEKPPEAAVIEHQPRGSRIPQYEWAQEEPNRDFTPQALYRATPYLPHPQPIPTENQDRLSDPYNPYRDLLPERCSNFASEDQLRTAIINSCRGVAELENSLVKTTVVSEQRFADFGSSMETLLVRQKFMSHLLTKGDQLCLVRRYNRSDNMGKSAFIGSRGTREGVREDLSKYSTNFASAEFNSEAKMLGITCKLTTLSCLERRPLRRKKRKRSRWPNIAPSRRSRSRQRFP